MSAAQNLIEAAEAVCDRWDSPLWKDAKPTADYIAALREAVRGLREAGEPVAGWKLVPVTADLRMVVAGGVALTDASESDIEATVSELQACYAAMVAAAPPSPAPQPESPCDVPGLCAKMNRTCDVCDPPAAQPAQGGGEVVPFAVAVRVVSDLLRLGKANQVGATREEDAEVVLRVAMREMGAATSATPASAPPAGEPDLATPSGGREAGPEEDRIEAAYWRFDARHKGYGEWKRAPMSERDAFKAEMRNALGAEKVRAEMRLVARGWHRPSPAPQPVRPSCPDGVVCPAGIICGPGQCSRREAAADRAAVLVPRERRL